VSWDSFPLSSAGHTTKMEAAEAGLVLAGQQEAAEAGVEPAEQPEAAGAGLMPAGMQPEAAQALLAAMREQLASMTAQPQMLWLSTEGAEQQETGEAGPAQFERSREIGDLSKAALPTTGAPSNSRRWRQTGVPSRFSTAAGGLPTSGISLSDWGFLSCVISLPASLRTHTSARGRPPWLIPGW
jgi:hypothetical protein